MKLAYLSILGIIIQANGGRVMTLPEATEVVTLVSTNGKISLCTASSTRTLTTTTTSQVNVYVLPTGFTNISNEGGSTIGTSGLLWDLGKTVDVGATGNQSSNNSSVSTLSQLSMASQPSTFMWGIPSTNETIKTSVSGLYTLPTNTNFITSPIIMTTTPLMMTTTPIIMTTTPMITTTSSMIMTSIKSYVLYTLPTNTFVISNSSSGSSSSSSSSSDQLPSFLFSQQNTTMMTPQSIAATTSAILPFLSFTTTSSQSTRLYTLPSSDSPSSAFRSSWLMPDVTKASQFVYTLPSPVGNFFTSSSFVPPSTQNTLPSQQSSISLFVPVLNSSISSMAMNTVPVYSLPMPSMMIPTSANSMMTPTYNNPMMNTTSPVNSMMTPSFDNSMMNTTTSSEFSLLTTTNLTQPILSTSCTNTHLHTKIMVMRREYRNTTIQRPTRIIVPVPVTRTQIRILTPPLLPPIVVTRTRTRTVHHHHRILRRLQHRYRYHYHRYPQAQSIWEPTTMRYPIWDGHRVWSPVTPVSSIWQQTLMNTPPATIPVPTRTPCPAGHPDELTPERHPIPPILSNNAAVI